VNEEAARLRGSRREGLERMPAGALSMTTTTTTIPGLELVPTSPTSPTYLSHSTFKLSNQQPDLGGPPPLQHRIYEHPTNCYSLDWEMLPPGVGLLVRFSAVVEGRSTEYGVVHSQTITHPPWRNPYPSALYLSFSISCICALIFSD
jgi:hypothetical protein